MRLQNKFRFVVLSLCLVLCGCGGESKLWKQTDFPLGESYPYGAKILDPVNQMGCSAVLLSERTALTAAHCLQREGSFLVLAPAGVSSAKEAARLGTGTAEDSYDLAILSLSDPLPAREYPAVGSHLKEGEKLTFLGFGCQNMTQKTSTGVMQVGENTIVELSKFAYTLTPAALARGIVGIAGGSGLCFGDSGGPGLRTVGETKELVALSHAVAESAEGHYSIFVNLTGQPLRDFLVLKNDELNLGITFH